MNLSRLTAGVLLSFLAVAGLAQSAPPQPTVIDAEQFDWRNTDTEMISVLTGKVVMTGTNLRLTCDRLEIVALRKGDPAATIGKIEGFKSLIATGNVRIVEGDREAACGQAEIRPGEDKVILTGQPVVVDHTMNWTYAGDILELRRAERRVTGTNPRFIGPALKDLGVDKKALIGPAKAPTIPPKDATPAQPPAKP